MKNPVAITLDRKTESAPVPGSKTRMCVLAPLPTALETSQSSGGGEAATRKDRKSTSTCTWQDPCTGNRRNPPKNH